MHEERIYSNDPATRAEEEVLHEANCDPVARKRLDEIAAIKTAFRVAVIGTLGVGTVLGIGIYFGTMTSVPDIGFNINEQTKDLARQGRLTEEDIQSVYSKAAREIREFFNEYAGDSEMPPFPVICPAAPEVPPPRHSHDLPGILASAP